MGRKQANTSRRPYYPYDFGVEDNSFKSHSTRTRTPELKKRFTDMHPKSLSPMSSFQSFSSDFSDFDDFGPTDHEMKLLQKNQTS